jgi:hypothetical protein
MVGVDALVNRSKKIDRVVGRIVSDRIEEIVLSIEGEAKKNIQKRSSGLKEIRYGGRGVKGTASRRLVTVSKSGDSPNTDTGRLISSIRHVFDRIRNFGEAGTDERYGRHLEFGTKHMDARPWLWPAFRKVVKSLRNRKWKKIKVR